MKVSGYEPSVFTLMSTLLLIALLIFSLTSDEGSLTNWLYDRYQEKEELLNNFKEKGARLLPHRIVELYSDRSQGFIIKRIHY